MTYEDQIDIFNRIQRGVTLTQGELVSSQFISDNVTQNFNKYCDGITDLFSKFIANDKLVRKEHHGIIIKVMYMIANNTLKRPTATQSENYIKGIKTTNMLKTEIAKVESLLKLVFSDDVLGDDSITQKLSPSFLITVCVSVNKLFAGNFTKCNKLYLTSAIRKLYREITSKTANESNIKGATNTIDNIEKIVTRLKSYYNGIVQKQLEMSTDDNEPSEEVAEESESSEEIIIVKKIVKQPAKIVKQPVKIVSKVGRK